VAIFTGGAGKSGGGGASFLPADYIQRKSELRNNIIILTLFAVVMAGLYVGFMMNQRRKIGLGREYRDVLAQCEAESKKIEQLAKLQEARAAMMEKAEITAALLEKVPRWTVLGEVRYRLPGSGRLEQVEMKGTRTTPTAMAAQVAAPKVKSLTDDVANKQKDAKPKLVAPNFNYDFTITGTTRENNDVADYLATLKQSPVFRDVQLNYIKEAKDGEELVRKFEIAARLRADVDKRVLGDSIRTLIALRAKEAGEPQLAGEQAASTQDGSNAAQVTDANTKQGE
jgi:Tfp pilus assembly protein PilN